jgi:hypothetical protein
MPATRGFHKGIVIAMFVSFLSFTRLLIILLQSGDLAGCFCLIYVLLPFLSFLSFSVSPPLFYVVIRF